MMQARMFVTGLAIVCGLVLTATCMAQGEVPASQAVTRPFVHPISRAPSSSPATAPSTGPATAPSTGPATAPSGPLPRVVLEIGRGDENWGRIVIEVNQDKVPITADNFLQYVDDGFYDGTLFHRVIPDYLIQGGGYVSLTELKKTGLRRPIRNEARNGLKNVRGTIAMARTRNPASATAQFFINLADNPNLDFPVRDGWGYCAFGTVVEGMDVVERIKDVPTQHDAAANVDRSPSQPIDPPMIKRAYRLGGTPGSRPAELRLPEPGPEEPSVPETEAYNQESPPEPPPEDRPPSKPETGEPTRR
jgi:peptidyl-prolyl cis-trans isomerase B (cyclophilin B)